MKHEEIGFPLDIVQKFVSNKTQMLECSYYDDRSLIVSKEIKSKRNGL
jgi:hypothetical protein